MGIVNINPGSRNLPDQIAIHDKPQHSGGEGNIYFSPDDKYVIKIYHHPNPEKPKLLQHILNLGENLGDADQHLAWPLGIVNNINGNRGVGVITRRVPSTHLPLVDLIKSPIDAVDQFRKGISWLEYLKIARCTAAAVRTIHGKGMAHGDIHLKNFLADSNSGEVIMIDLDGLIVKGFLPPQVKGMTGFMAPEVIVGKSKPSDLTDRYSLSVLVLWILLLRNVMLTQKCHDPDDPMHDDELGYGQYACFSENANDKRNWISNIGTPLFRRGALSYSSLTPKLQNLTNRALISGLHKPSERPMASEWDKALAEAYDALISCAYCRQSFFYQYWIQPPPRRRCPFCGNGVKAPLPTVLELLEERTKGSYVPIRFVILYHGLPIFVDLIKPGKYPPFARRGTTRIGQVSWDRRENYYRVINMTHDEWRIISGGNRIVKRGETLPLRKGIIFSFGTGNRLARVVE